MSAGTFRVVVDRSRCIGSGQCVSHAGAVFDQSEEDGTVILLVSEPDLAMREAVEKAARLCPAQAIAIAEVG